MVDTGSYLPNVKQIWLMSFIHSLSCFGISKAQQFTAWDLQAFISS